MPHYPSVTFLEVEKEDREMILKRFPGAMLSEGTLSEEECIEFCQDAEIVCCFIYSVFSQNVLRRLPKLRLLVTRSVGFDHIDLLAAAEQGIRVCNVPDYGSHVIAEHVFALMLSALRHVVEGEMQTNTLHFDFHGLRGIALKGKTIGIIGVGNIGLHVARIASRGFLMKVLAFDPCENPLLAKEYHFQYTSLEEIWKNSDIITLHCPLNSHTEHLINEAVIAQMKTGVSIINTSRGGILDTKALLDGVRSGKIAHVALDVLEHEEDIQQNQEILTYPNILITPHIAFYADDSVQRMYEESFLSVEEYLRGAPLTHEVQVTEHCVLKI